MKVLSPHTRIEELSLERSCIPAKHVSQLHKILRSDSQRGGINKPPHSLLARWLSVRSRIVVKRLWKESHLEVLEVE
jgi:hypothetical protein